MKVSLFITCLSDLVYPKVGESMVQLLAKYGVKLDFP
ncbi:Fe-S oxidoreductase, partial [Paenibacillus sp. LMG 31460]|nr:Fe-S oxidoreductase [Paenibacillus germinis]